MLTGKLSWLREGGICKLGLGEVVMMSGFAFVFVFGLFFLISIFFIHWEMVWYSDANADFHSRPMVCGRY